MVHKRNFVLSLIGIIAMANIANANNNEKSFGIVITKERSATVVTNDYGTLSCTSIEFQRYNGSLVIVNGRSNKGFSGGMIYEADKKGDVNLFTPDSIWGGIIHHTEPGFDDASLQVRVAVVGICQDALYNKTI